MPAHATSSFISIQNINVELADGRRLFNDLSCTFNIRQTAIVGANGIGKSVLANILAGIKVPTTGAVYAQGRVGFIPQCWPGLASDCLDKVLGLDCALTAMAAIEAGNTDQKNFDIAEPWWNWQTKLKLIAEEIELSNVEDIHRPIGSYSGGEQLRWLWAAALLKEPDIIVMDEPSNHLDQKGRQFLNQWIQQSTPLVLIVSHDRELLSGVNHIVELSAQNCFQHSGNFDVYQSNRQQRQQKQQKDLTLARQTLSTEKQQAQTSLEKQQQRTASGIYTANKKNRSALEIGAARNQASASMQRSGRLHSDRIAMAQDKVKNLAEAVEWQDPIVYELPDFRQSSKRICAVEKLQNQFDRILHPEINFTLFGSQRMQVVGKNGCGKSLLLKCLSQQYQPNFGSADIYVPFAMLDQHTSNLDGEESGLENFRRLSPGFTEQQYRMRLAWVRLRAYKADIKVRDLSGGERLKVAIAVALLGPQCPQLLLLDEPSNHLDLDSLLALEQALSAYSGALVVVSHDLHFAGKLQLTQQLNLETAEIKAL